MSQCAPSFMWLGTDIANGIGINIGIDINIGIEIDINIGIDVNIGIGINISIDIGIGIKNQYFDTPGKPIAALFPSANIIRCRC